MNAECQCGGSTKPSLVFFEQERIRDSQCKIPAPEHDKAIRVSSACDVSVEGPIKGANQRPQPLSIHTLSQIQSQGGEMRIASAAAVQTLVGVSRTGDLSGSILVIKGAPAAPRIRPVVRAPRPTVVLGICHWASWIASLSLPADRPTNQAAIGI